MTDWDVKVQLDSNYIKTVRVNDCFDRNDAELQAKSTTGVKNVIVSNPVCSTQFERNYTFYDDRQVDDVPVSESEKIYKEYDVIDKKYNELDKLDEMEEEMYDLMCRIAMEEGEKLPTIQEFYDYIGKE